MTTELPIANISCYLFASLTDLKNLREHLLAFCKERALKGTILLSTEGVNFFIAGPRGKVDELVAELKRVPGLEKLAPKYSYNEEQPFNRMLVRIKKEIIAFGVEGIDPAQYTSPRLKPVELKAWLDEGKPVVLLDTRNDYEVKLGTFKNATIIGVDQFRDFPEAVRRLPVELKAQPIVSFCTGGIRCEKAAPFLEKEGFQKVWQLDGGILKYFEEVGGDHWEGECFVFDQRVGLDPALRETGSAQCFVCQAPLTEEEQSDPRYQQGKSCPYCYKTDAEKLLQQQAAHQQALDALATALPGCVAYENRRPISIPERADGQPLLSILSELFPHVEAAEWMSLFHQGLMVDDHQQGVTSERIMRAGERVYQVQPGLIEPAVNGRIRLLHEDSAILVCEKPAPLPMHACGRFHRNTFQHLLHTVYAPEKPRACHRLDANTSGLVVCARTRHFAKLVQKQFAQGQVEKVYLARVHGHPTWDEHCCALAIGSEASDLGSRDIDEETGDPAETQFRVLSREADGTAWVQARPLTGRTNQIRVHLWQLGHPIVGDPTYLREGAKGDTQTLPVEAPPMQLHAHRVQFQHPLTGKKVCFESFPQWYTGPR